MRVAMMMRAALFWMSILVLLTSFSPVAANQPVPLAAAAPTGQPASSSGSRGYQTTPQELVEVARKAAQGIEPYASAVDDVLSWANRPWTFRFDPVAYCPDAHTPEWNDDTKGTATLYSRALAYHLTGEERYAQEAAEILERIMTEVRAITLDQQQCRLNFAWGTPELVSSADLLEDYWQGKTCRGPASFVYGENELTTGPCKMLFQNWLVKNAYYVISYSAERSQSNWGAAATNATAHVADYVLDRPEMRLVARTGVRDVRLTPRQAYLRARRLALDRMNGYRVELDSNRSCDVLSGPQQNRNLEPVKSQITELGIIPEDARRDEYCNITAYDGSYQNYPQVHLGNNIQQCELMLRRGDASCYDNVSRFDVPDYPFTGPDGKRYRVTLRQGRGSIERAIKAIIVDSQTEWRHDSALEAAYRYYSVRHTLPGIEQWQAQLDRPARCWQDMCFGTLTHGFAPGETLDYPPVAPVFYERNGTE